MRIIFFIFLIVSSAAFAAVDDANTIALIHFNEASGTTTVVDETGGGWTKYGDFKHVTDPKFGSGSGYFNNNSIVFLQSEYTTTVHLATGDYTIDCWVKPSSINTLNAIFSQNDGGVKLFFRYKDSSGHIHITDGTTTSGTTPLYTWTHVALVRSAGVETIYFNGLEQCKGYSNFNFGEGPFYIGSDYDPYSGSQACYSGLIDEFRISNVARWTAEFTPPAAEYGPLPIIAARVGLAGDGKLFFAENGKYLLGVQP